MRRLLAIIVIGCGLAGNCMATEDQLLFIYGPECGACQRFMREVETNYSKTQESQRLPLIRVTFDDWQARQHSLSECAVQPVFGTPTFILLQDCHETDRITGYSNDELFWISHRRLMNRLD